jgi:alanine racemase
MTCDRAKRGVLGRRKFLAAAAGVAAATALPRASSTVTPASPAQTFRLRPGGHDDGFDPWIEIIADAFRHNVRETSRLAGGRPLLAVIKNNAYGLGDQLIGPLVSACDEVAGLACTRTSEAVAMQEAGVKKPILNMAEVGEGELMELARRDCWASVWLDDAPARIEHVAKKLGRPVGVHLYLDCGMGREGMPDHRAMPWMEKLASGKSARIDGTYMMFSHDLEYDREQLTRFNKIVSDAQVKGLKLGRIHTSPSIEVLYVPEARFDMVRPGNLLFGNYLKRPELTTQPDLKTVFRLCAKVVRLEQLQPGESASFGRAYVAQAPTWIALLPVGHTDGYPANAAGRCQVLIRGKLYWVVSVVSSSHVIVEIGPEKSVEVGDVATLIGPDDPAITPHAIADKTELGFYPLITKMNALLPKKLV